MKQASPWNCSPGCNTHELRNELVDEVIIEEAVERETGRGLALKQGGRMLGKWGKTSSR
jgi:hypothetical protein